MSAEKGSFEEFILNTVKENRSKIEHNNTIFEILEGNLMKYLSINLKDQFSEKSSRIALKRAAPINVLGKIISKLSTLYSEAPSRKTGNDQNDELINFYEKNGVNLYLKDLNRNFNAYKYSVMEIYEDYEFRSLSFRSIPSNMFIPFSHDQVNPLRATGIIKFAGKSKNKYGREIEKFHVITKDYFFSIDENGDYIEEDMLENEGINPFGVLPYSYISKSRFSLIPIDDTDIVKMTLNIPTLFTDANYNSMYNSVPIVYGINIDDENIQRAPEVFWNLRSTEPGEASSIGVLKSDMEVESQLKLITSQLAMWLDTKNIRPGAVGKITMDNFASGISKIIDEADTIQDRRDQESYFKVLENDFWRKLGTIHNILVKSGRIEEKKMFVEPEKMNVQVDFSDIQVIEDKASVIDNAINKLNAGLITKQMAIKEIYPDMSSEEIDKVIEEASQPQEIIVRSN